MNRVIIVFNPRSTRFKDVEREVLDASRNLTGYTVGKYEVKPTSIEENAACLAKVLNDDDLVISAGGDATGIISVHGIINSGKDARLAVLPYGNFNDLARTLGTFKFDDVFKGKVKKLYPLDIIVDGKHFRYATCYVTMGMTGEAVELFDDKDVRKKLQKGHKSSWCSYVNLVKWYFKNRHKKLFIPEFKLNGELMHIKTSDYCALNGRSMCRVMKGGDWYLKKDIFLHMTGKLANFWNLSILMTRSIFKRVPGSETKGDVIEFIEPATVELQAEGEYKKFSDIKKIEIRKSDQALKVISLR